jgi:Flp pilus assembly protein TadG
MNRGALKSLKRLLAREEGITIVEMGICTSVLMAMLLGIFQISVAVYNFQLVADAAREGSRFAMVRGSNCATYLTTAYCSPYDSSQSGADGVDISSYVNSLGYIGHSHLISTTTWLTASTTTPTTWSACSSGTCNAPGNMVKVTVTYNYPLNIPFAPSITIPIRSTSAEVIAQ